MRRVSVIGVSGAGKSTVARGLAARIGAPHVELDAIFHQPDWTPLPDDEFLAKVAAIIAGDAWVVDGNYSTVQPLVWERADTVVWLDLPRRTAMRQLLWRTLRRVAMRAELWNGNRERWRNLVTLNEEESVILWSWRHHPTYRERYTAAMRDPAYAHLTFIRVTGRGQARQLMRGPAPAQRPDPEHGSAGRPG